MCEPHLIAGTGLIRGRAPTPHRRQLPERCASWPPTCRSSRSCRAGPSTTTAAASSSTPHAGVDLTAADARRGRVGVPAPGHQRGRTHPDRPAPARRAPGCTGSGSKPSAWPATTTCSPRPTPWPGAPKPAANRPARLHRSHQLRQLPPLRPALARPGPGRRHPQPRAAGLVRLAVHAMTALATMDLDDQIRARTHHARTSTPGCATSNPPPAAPSRSASTATCTGSR